MIFKNEDFKRAKRSKIEETDSFWDVCEITPPIKNKSKQSTVRDTEPVLVFDDRQTLVKPQGQVIVPRQVDSEILFEYLPENIQIERVTVCSWPSKYTFYERFKNDAQKYFNIKCDKCEPVSYFSYMPSYLQMSIRQRKWYFYWRDRVRNGDYLPTDSSYILLYIYEIINLPELIPPQKGLELLCNVWEKYRSSYTKLDKYLSEWVCDYCLVNKLSPPFDRIAVFYDRALEEASLKQFYIKSEEAERYSSLLMEGLSDYKWSNSKYITEENKAVFSEHIRRGFSYAVNILAVSDGRFDRNSGRIGKKKIIRDAFSGALCAYDSKRKLVVEYYELENVNELGFIVTDMVRYCENRVRAYFGIRARLKIQNLTEYQKSCIDEYFDTALPCAYSYKKKSTETDVYEIAQEPKSFELSFEKAREIEEKSWSITDRLVEYEDEDIELENVSEELSEPAKKSVEVETLDFAKEALRCIASNDMVGFLKIAEEGYMLAETLAECVNELCFELLGDIGIEECEDGYRLIPDYEEEIRGWLKS